MNSFKSMASVAVVPHTDDVTGTEMFFFMQKQQSGNFDSFFQSRV
ncbi:MAG: hypothetical protein AB1552_08070 [Nitrospirota bacterium]